MSPLRLAAVCLLLGVFVSNLRAETPGQLSASLLRCEAKTGPLGIDVATPRLSWVVESNRRAEKQTAYHVLVATKVDLLAPGKADLWDSGKVESDTTFGIVYAGKPLASHQICYWTVQVCDRDGNPSAWSSPSHWTMGLLKPSDFQAKWIGLDAYRQTEASEAPFGEARWIWHAPDKGSMPKAHRLFVASFQVPADAGIEAARVLVAADDAAKFTLNGQLVATTEGFTNVAEADIKPHIKVGPNTVRVEVENKQPGPAGLIARIDVTLKGGHVISLVTNDAWRTLADPGANWHNRPLDTNDWPAAAVVGKHGDAPWGTLRYSKLTLPPAVYLHHDFTTPGKVRRATLYAASLGIADYYLNGQRINTDYFPSGWTDYTKRVYYRAYEVTERVKDGRNILGAILSDGWYSGYVGFGKKRDHYGTKPRVWTQLHLEFEDGTTRDVVSSPEWQGGRGPILEADFLMGETFDARRQGAAWGGPDIKAGELAPVDVGAEVSPRIEAHPGPPVVHFATLAPLTVTQPTPGAYVLDMGQNFAGVVRLKVQGKPGQEITLRFAERLNPDGSIYTTNLREARCTDTYICKGEGVEVWEPRFTFHGFQYVEVRGLSGPPAGDTITGLALSSDTPQTGHFDSSGRMLNQLHSNIVWTQRANFIDIPTDCPQRDERLGWTGDAQVYIRTATLNTDVQAFFNKWLVDLTDGQRADGQFPMVAPVKVAGDDGGPAWADAGVICPWTVYQVYGDREVLARQYPSMVKFVEFCRKRSVDGVLPPKAYHCFGDWLSINADTPKDVIYTAYFANSARLTGQAAAVLGKTDDAKTYQDLYERIRAAFNRTYVAHDGKITGDTQAVYVLALAFDLLDADKAMLAAKHLVADIESKKNHLSTGFIGTKDLMLVLAKIGRTDVALKLLHNTSFPSWGFSIEHGATSIWERWDGWTPNKGFQDPGMNSFAHYSFGAVYQWMVENLGGIRANEPSYRTITIAPVIDPSLAFANVAYQSIRGDIRSHWIHQGKTLTLDVHIPANTRATLQIPAASADAVVEDGKPLKDVDGVKVVGLENGKLRLEVASGHYAFTSQNAP
ncbi:MAG: family 78 glycoside hydrolase catalytic domain [Isosphaeraceae bacterium]